MMGEKELRLRQAMRDRGEPVHKLHETTEEFLARGGRVMYVPKGVSSDFEYHYNGRKSFTLDKEGNAK